LKLNILNRVYNDGWELEKYENWNNEKHQIWINVILSQNANKFILESEDR
jgi:hypothetical protein